MAQLKGFPKLLPEVGITRIAYITEQQIHCDMLLKKQQLWTQIRIILISKAKHVASAERHIVEEVRKGNVRLWIRFGRPRLLNNHDSSIEMEVVDGIGGPQLQKIFAVIIIDSHSTLLNICGQCAQVIDVSGNRMSAAKVKSALLLQNSAAEITVIGTPDEAVNVFVILRVCHLFFSLICPFLLEYLLAEGASAWDSNIGYFALLKDYLTLLEEINVKDSRKSRNLTTLLQRFVFHWLNCEADAKGLWFKYAFFNCFSQADQLCLI
ncbi:hypothetical protein BT96DRAFT_1044215 [Gymnopus androsaceus JB14]|uniref:Uncharacterized protein n=1 Tax=Gymnopus androsaceus JB14 TaxID=1447944 RepID=A0A6A4I9C3_9AGAR|nr:hypothetical protein BT96DRAFT_1044215 [Gymnopus androsaceus JB14]